MFAGRKRNWLQASAPAAFAHFIRINEIVGFLAAFMTFQQHWTCDSANRKSAGERLAFDPFGESHGHVAIEILGGFFLCEEKRPRTKQNSHAYCGQN